MKEYGTPFAWISGLCALGLIRGTAAESSLAAVLVAILVLAGISWGIARWLKKARIVVAD